MNTQIHSENTQALSEAAHRDMQILVTGTQKSSGFAAKLEKSGYQTEFYEMQRAEEEEGANFNFKDMAPALKHAREHDYAMVIGVDQPLNKLCVAIRKRVDGPFQLLTVHQLAVLVADVLITDHEEESFLCIRSVHISDMLENMVLKRGKDCQNVIENSKELRTRVRESMPQHKGIFTVTENQEFNYNNLGILPLVEQLVQLEQASREHGKTIFDSLIELYREYGFYKEKTLVVNIEENTQKEHFAGLMESFRNNPPSFLGNYNLKKVVDYKRRTSRNLMTGKKLTLDLPATNMIRLYLSEDTSITFAPSENKMHHYISMAGSMGGKEDYQEISQRFDERIIKFMEAINKL